MDANICALKPLVGDDGMFSFRVKFYDGDTLIGGKFSTKRDGSIFDIVSFLRNAADVVELSYEETKEEK